MNNRKGGVLSQIEYEVIRMPRDLIRSKMYPTSLPDANFREKNETSLYSSNATITLTKTVFSLSREKCVAHSVRPSRNIIHSTNQVIDWFLSRFQRMGRHQKSNGANASMSTISVQEATSIIPSDSVQFWSILLLEIPSLACTLFLLYHLLRDRHLWQALHNHVIIILLVLTLGIEIFDNPLYIDASRIDGSHNSFTMVPSICLMWWLFDYGAYGAITVFLAWGSIERHILVFHPRQLLRTARQRFFVHYLPLIILSFYLTTFYVVVILFPPCENTFDFGSVACGLSPCYLNVSYLNLWDYLVNGILCTSIETACSVGLLVRVFWQKHRAHRPMNWRKHRKMSFQLLSVSCLSLTFVVPQSLIVVIRRVGGSNLAEFANGWDPYLTYLYTFVVLLLPFICLICLSELWPRIWFLNWKSRRAIGPLAIVENVEQGTLAQS